MKETDSEHLLLAILKEGYNIAAKILNEEGINYRSVYNYLISGTNLERMEDNINDKNQEDLEEFTAGYTDDEEDDDDDYALHRNDSHSNSSNASQPKSPNDTPVLDNFGTDMRRMREMSALQPGMAFYGEMPDNYNLVVNTDHELVKKLLADEEQACNEQLKPIADDLKGWKARQSDLRETQNKKKEEEITSEEKEDMKFHHRPSKHSIFYVAKGSKFLYRVVDTSVPSTIWIIYSSMDM